MEMLRVENLTKLYGEGENQVRALDGVSFSVDKGQFVAIIGPRALEKAPCCISWVAWTGPPMAKYT